MKLIVKRAPEEDVVEVYLKETIDNKVRVMVSDGISCDYVIAVVTREGIERIADVSEKYGFNLDCRSRLVDKTSA